MPVRTLITVVAILSWVASSSPVHGQALSLRGQKVLPDPDQAGARFGTSMAVDRDRWVIGIPDAAPQGIASGVVRVLRWSGDDWQHEADLTPTAPSVDGIEFGSAVAMDGDTLWVGAPSDDGSAADAGAVYVFEFDGSQWSQVQVLFASDASSADAFGTALDLEAGRGLVGAASADPMGNASGAVYAFRHGGSWSEDAKLVPGDGGAEDRFGHSVRLASGFAICGCPGHGLPQQDAGAVYCFADAPGWPQTQKLQGPAPGAGASFGATVVGDDGWLAVASPGTGGGTVELHELDSGLWQHRQTLDRGEVVASEYGPALGMAHDLLVVGIPLNPGQHAPFGIALSYARVDGVWEFEQFIDPVDIDEGDHFAESVAAGDEHLVFSVPGDDELSTDAGAAVSYRRYRSACVTDRETQKLLPPGFRDGARFGTSLDRGGEWLAVGAPNASLARRTGAVSIFRQSPSGWTFHSELEGASSLDRFGSSVSVDGARMAVGIPGEDNGANDAGSVLMYEYLGGVWQPQQELFDALPQSGASFGSHVQVFGDTVWAGAPWDDVSGTPGAGSIRFLRFNGLDWEQHDRLHAPTPTVAEGWGMTFDVDVDGDLIAVGSPQSSMPKQAMGRVDVFRHDGTDWQHEQTLFEQTPRFDGQFGQSVGVRGDVLVVSAPGGSDLPQESVVHVYRFDGVQWALDQTIDGEQTRTSTQVFAVELDRDEGGLRAGGRPRLLIGWRASDRGFWAGAVDLYRDDGQHFVRQQRLLTSDASPVDYLGWSLCFAEEEAFVGAPGVDDTCPSGVDCLDGGVYTFDLGLALDATPDQKVRDGDRVDFRASGGAAAGLYLVVAVEINGRPSFHRLALGLLDAVGEWSLAASVPPGLDGLEVAFELYAFEPDGKIGASNRERVEFGQ